MNKTETKMTPPQKPSAPDLVRAGLRREILSGDLESGTPLRQDELADRFGTSRIPVREALRQLESEGLVTINPNRGAVVSMQSIEEVMEMLDIRVALESSALKHAIPVMAAEDLARAKDILMTYDAQLDPNRWDELNWLFHEALYAPCNKPRMMAMIKATYGQVARFRRVRAHIATGKDIPQREHWEILSACQDRKTDLAVQHLEHHILETQKSLMAILRRGNGAAAAAGSQR